MPASTWALTMPATAARSSSSVTVPPVWAASVPGRATPGGRGRPPLDPQDHGPQLDPQDHGLELDLTDMGLLNRPRLAGDVEVGRLEDRWGDDVLILTNPRTVMHVGMTKDELTLVEAMDGTRTID